MPIKTKMTAIGRKLLNPYPISCHFRGFPQVTWVQPPFSAGIFPQENATIGKTPGNGDR